MAFLKTLFDGNERELVKLRRTVERVNALEPSIAALSDEQLAAKTDEFKARLADGRTQGTTDKDLLDALLPEAFAVVREAGKRVLGMRHFDVQIMGGQALHEGNVAEMRTGEGKTLVATLPVYLNALTDKGVHVVTVNDYLAKRDAEWMGPIYTALGLTVGVIQHDLDPAARKAAYDADVTYVTNNEVGFDYLRDNMAWALDQMVQRDLNFAIVDEVDSILIDEARTPLIISGQGHDATELYAQFAKIIPRLVKDTDFTVDQKSHAVPITEAGVAKVEKMLGIQNLYDQRNLELTHQLNAALKAWHLFHRDQQYIVKDGEVVIVDEFTGRLMYGRRYSDGIHQAIEAKEGLERPQRGPDARDDHVPELLPPVRQARRHDGHREDRGARVPRDLRSRRGRAPDEHAGEAQGLRRHRVPQREREVQRGHRRHHRRAREGASGARRHALDREVRAPCADAASPRRRVQRAQREVSRAGSADHQGRGPVRRGDDRDEHGGPRRRHQARRGRSRSSAACTSSAPNGTSRGASTTSCADVPDARAIPARRVSTSRSKTS